MKLRIFVSSVQAEFAKERKQLAAYIREDALLADFFDVFLFEEQPARSRSAQSVFLGEVEECDVYLGLFGGMYAGRKGTVAISPTEREYDLAKKLGKTMLGFVRTGVRREKREAAFIREKVDADLSRNPFANFDELKIAVYKSLVTLLKEQDEISNRPFDQSFSRHVKMSDLDEEKFRDFRKRINPDKKTLEAEAMSWTDYVERSGYGTREILSQCRERGLSRPIFEPSTGSFKVVLWRNGYGPDLPKDRMLGSSGGPVVVQSWSSRIVAVVQRSKEVSTTDIVKALGLKATNGSIKRALKSLIDDKIVEYTIPEKPNSRLQKYRLTAKGRAIIPMGM